MKKIIGIILIINVCIGTRTSAANIQINNQRDQSTEVIFTYKDNNGGIHGDSSWTIEPGKTTTVNTGTHCIGAIAARNPGSWRKFDFLPPHPHVEPTACFDFNIAFGEVSSGKSKGNITIRFPR